SNPELDNIRPDYDLMYRLASEAEDVFNRMGEANAAALRKALVRPKLKPVEGKDADKEKAELPPDKPRLFFTLENAHLIPVGRKEERQTPESRGPHKDGWDEALTLYQPSREKDEGPEPQPVKISYVLLIVVGLLGTEWLIRKLLRLA